MPPFVFQREFILNRRPRGFHLITDEVIRYLGELPKEGIVNLFILHTSAGITINENTDPDVLTDFNSFFNRLVPEDLTYLKHTMEGPDDMPAHIKSSIVGHHLTIPISNHKLRLGTWQGIYLCEFRNNGGSRKFVATVIGA